MKKLENMTKEELEKAIDNLVKNTINELELFRITLKDWKRYKHTYDVLKSRGMYREDLAVALSEVMVNTKTDYEREILNQMLEEIENDLKPKSKKLEMAIG